MNILVNKYDQVNFIYKMTKFDSQWQHYKMEKPT